MKDYKIYRSNDYEKVHPNFIYNRFELWEGQVHGEISLWCYESNLDKIFFEVLCMDSVARIGLWLSPITPRILRRIVKYIFKHNNKIKKITFENACCAYGIAYKHNHFRIELPDSSEKLNSRLSSKGRYNIKREKRLLVKDFGRYKIEDYQALSPEAEKIWKSYFAFKETTHDCNYGLSPQEYCNKYHVTNLYVLSLGDDERVAAIILSCEQCPVVYIENLSYDTELARYSPGQVLYDEYLKTLIDKKVYDIFLLGGNYAYKRRYDSIEEFVYNCVAYRNIFLQQSKRCLNCVRKIYRDITKK